MSTLIKDFYKAYGVDPELPKPAEFFIFAGAALAGATLGAFDRAREIPGRVRQFAGERVGSLLGSHSDVVQIVIEPGQPTTADIDALPLRTVNRKGQIQEQ